MTPRRKDEKEGSRCRCVQFALHVPGDVVGGMVQAEPNMVADNGCCYVVRTKISGVQWSLERPCLAGYYVL